ncbi:glycoside hydrolase superfamily [Aspergillus karnatakaensis]|uniref:class III chitinase ChiA1 n=1 Tax=Aspergillus karnatakaensis TaxID=1810916 RepID=UPI003CCDC028
MAGKLLTLVSVISGLASLASAFVPEAKSNVAMYYGQGYNQPRLAEFCQDPSIDIINIGFINRFPEQDPLTGLPGSDFGNQCWAETYEVNGIPSNLYSHCLNFEEDIKACQNAGKKVFLSLGGGHPTYWFNTIKASTDFGNWLWGAFGPVTDAWEAAASPRPFGNAVVDGFDLDIEYGGSLGYANLVKVLRKNFEKDAEKKYYISAAPQCPIPDAQLSVAIRDSFIDFVWVQFYNSNPCSARDFVAGTKNGFNFDQWVNVIKSGANPNAKLYIGLPASKAAAQPGFYLTPEEVKPLAKKYMNKYPDTFGGIMLWEATESMNNEIGGVSYAANIRDILFDLDPNHPTPTPTPTPTSTTTSTTTTSTSTTTSTTTTTTTSTTTSTSTSTSTSTTSTSTSTSTSSSTSTPSPTLTATSTSTSSTETSTSTSTSETSSSTSTPIVSETSSHTPTPSSTPSASQTSTTVSSSSTESSTSTTTSTSSTTASSHIPSTPGVPPTSTKTTTTVTVFPTPPGSSSPMPSSSAVHTETSQSSSTSETVTTTSPTSKPVIPTSTASHTSSASSSTTTPVTPITPSTPGVPTSTPSATTSPAHPTETDCDEDEDEPTATSPAQPTETDCDEDEDEDEPTSTTTAQPTETDCDEDEDEPTATSTTQSTTQSTSETATQSDTDSNPKPTTEPTTQPSGTGTVTAQPTTTEPALTTTVIVTSYTSICPTGFTTITTTLTSTYCPCTLTPTATGTATITNPGAVEPTTTPDIPEGWTTTVTVCTVCAATPTTVTLTLPPASSTGETSPVKPTDIPVGEVPSGENPTNPGADSTTTVVVVPSQPLIHTPYPSSTFHVYPSTSPVPTAPSGTQGGEAPAFTGAASRMVKGLSSALAVAVAALVVM